MNTITANEFIQALVRVLPKAFEPKIEVAPKAMRYIPVNECKFNLCELAKSIYGIDFRDVFHLGTKSLPSKIGEFEITPIDYENFRVVRAK